MWYRMREFCEKFIVISEGLYNKKVKAPRWMVYEVYKRKNAARKRVVFAKKRKKHEHLEIQKTMLFLF